jgi:hypothetical protein
MTGTGVQFQAGTRFFLYNAQTLSEALPAFRPNNTKGSFPRDKAVLHSEVRVRMHAVLFPFLNTSSWSDAYSSTKRTLPFLSCFLYTVAHLIIFSTCATQ